MHFIRVSISTFLFLGLSYLAYIPFNTFFHQFDSKTEQLFFFEKGKQGNRITHLEDVQKAYNSYGIEMMRIIESMGANGVKSQFPVPIETAGDDLGIYYIIPKIERTLTLGMENSFVFFFWILILCSFVLINIGISLLTKDTAAYIISTVITIFLCFFCFYMLEVYLFSLLAIAIVPLFIYAFKKKPYVITISLLIIAILLGFCNISRAHSATGVLIFITLLILFSNKNPFTKGVFILLLLIGGRIPQEYMNQVISTRNTQLNAQGYEKGMLEGYQNSHLFWHTLFLGLGYDKSNIHGIVWKDEYAYHRANLYVKMNPMLNYPRFNHINMPKEYEEIMQTLYVEIIKKDPIFIITTYSKKAIVTFFKSFLFLPSLLLFIKRKNSISTFILIGLPIIFYGLAGLVAIPHFMFFIGGIGLSVIFSILIYTDKGAFG